MKVTRLGNAVANVGESPVWDARAQVLYWVDINGQKIFRTALDGHTQVIELQEPVGSVACAADGHLIAALKTGVFRLDFDRPTLELLGAPPGHPSSHRFNDATTDGHGNFIVGTMSLDVPGEQSGRLYQLRRGGEWRLLLDGFRTVNGLATSMDGKTLYVSDSHPAERCVWRCEYDAEAAIVRRRDVFVRFNETLGRPDGAAVDADDHYWVTGNDGWAIHRFTPGGYLRESIAMPVQKPSKIAFGGTDLRKIFVTSIGLKIAEPERQPDAGALFVIDSDVRGLAIPTISF